MKQPPFHFSFYHLLPTAALFLVAMFLCESRVKAADETRPPNILFAIADDWGKEAGAYGTPWVKTPGFDRIAREGVLFTNAFTPMAKCAPSRAIILTGRHIWQLEEAGNHMAIFPPKFKSWPEVFLEKGWPMGITGKGWGPGIALDDDGEPRQITGISYHKHKAKPPADKISANDYAANFADFLNATPEGKPWAFWYGAAEPHRAYEYQAGVTKGGKKLSDIDKVPAFWPDVEAIRHDLLDYAFEVEHVDNHLVRMMDELERRGQLDNTVIIVTGDHGMPFPRSKGYAYPEGNRVPLAIRWPAGIKTPGRVVTDYVDFTEIAPTLLDLAGIPEEESGMQSITGKSWRPLLESGEEGRIQPWRDHVLIGKERTDIGRPNDWGYPIRGIVTDEYVFLRNYEPDRWPAGNPETGYLDTDASPTKSHLLEAGRLDRANPYWALNFGMRPAVELFELSSDPDCVENLADDDSLAEIRDRLEREMTARLEEQGDPRMFGRGHVFDEYPIHTDRTRNFYERFMKGELDESAAGWVDPTDFEPTPLPPTPVFK